MKFGINIKGWHSEDEWESVDAFDSEDAAEMAAEDYYGQDDGAPVYFNEEIAVKDHTGNVEIFLVTAEQTIKFCAYLKKVEGE